MSSRLFAGIATVASTLLVSCYPYPDDPYLQGPPPGHLPPPGHPSITSREQQEIQRQREEARERQAQRDQQTARRSDSSSSSRLAERDTSSSSDASSSGTSSSETQRKTNSSGTRAADYPFATPVVGQEGYVLSPYNQKKIDVRGIPTGQLVRDPTYPESEKKFFRVP